ncbi:hypothetical protein [Brevibacillus sp. JB24b]|uniref:hypothetical protein n=1 Tax=Brevibacillus sp. JB24b TaxID=3422308 RepID=UPI003F682F1D
MLKKIIPLGCALLIGIVSASSAAFAGPVEGNVYKEPELYSSVKTKGIVLYGPVEGN